VAEAHVALDDGDEVGEAATLGRGIFGAVGLEIFDDVGGIVGGAVVDEDNLAVGVVDLVEGFEAVLEGLCAIVRADDDADAGGCLEADAAGDEARAEEFLAKGFTGELGGAVACDEAEGPIGDIEAAGEPLVGPGEEDGAGGAAADDAIEVPIEDGGLHFLALADGVEAEFAHDQGLVAGEVLEAGEVALEVELAFEVDVEGVEVDVGREEILGGRVAGVGVERAGIGLAGDVDEVLDEMDDTADAEPADHGCGDFVTDEVTEDGFVALVFEDGIADGLDDLAADGAVVEELDMLSPRDGNEGADAEFAAEIEEPGGWDVVEADEVDAEGAHHFEVAASLRGVADEAALGIGSEGAVGDAFEEEFLVAVEEEFGADADGRERARRGGELRVFGFF